MSIRETVEVAPLGSNVFTDITHYIAAGGLKWSRNDIDASNSGRDTQDGLMHRKRVSQKIRLDITCRPLLQSELTILLNAIEPQWLSVRYYDPKANALVVKTMYTSTVPASFLFDDGVRQYWTGIEFPLIEQ
jgi:hypothetical protein